MNLEPTAEIKASMSCLASRRAVLDPENRVRLRQRLCFTIWMVRLNKTRA